MLANYEEFPQEEEIRSFDRERNGLVKYDSYLPYLIDPPEKAPIKPSGAQGSEFVRQHVYFTEPLYRQVSLPQEKRDPRLTRLRDSPYSQIVMRWQQEKKLHLEMEPYVEPPPISTVDDALKDFFDIDRAGAATLGMYEIKNPSSFSPWAEKFAPAAELQALSKRERFNIFKDIRDEALSALFSPRVVPHLLVGSALKRIAVYLRDYTLDRAANENLPDTKSYYPLRIPSKGHLQAVGTYMLKDAVGIMPLEESRRVQIQRISIPALT